MENESRWSEWQSRATDWLHEQVWYQEIKTKWESLDSQVKFGIRAGGLGLIALSLLIASGLSIWSVNRLKNELAEKNALINALQAANDEMRTLREKTQPSSSATGTSTGPWSEYFQSVAGTQGIDRSLLTLGGEKPGNSSDSANESLFDLALKKVSIKQVVRYAHGLETGSRPVKIRNILIDTQSDPAGYMDATLSVSAFKTLGAGSNP